MQRLRTFIALSIFLPSFCSATMAVPMASRPFRDVDMRASFFDAVAYLKNNGMITGYSDGTFRPYASVNRAEFLRILMGKNIVSQEERDRCMAGVTGKNLDLYHDVDRDAWYAPFFCIGIVKGILRGGNSDGLFHPDRTITFAEAATMIHRLYVGDTCFEDERTWYSCAVEWMGEHDAIPIAITSLDAPILRGDMAEMIYRIRAGIDGKPSKILEDFLEKKAVSKNFSPFIDLGTARVGDLVGGMIVRSINIRYEDDQHRKYGIVKFDGEVTVTGRYKVQPHVEGPAPSDTVCFDHFDRATHAVLPKVRGILHLGYFCLSIESIPLAKKHFPWPSEGTATIVIDQYSIPYIEAEAWQTARLVRVIDVNNAQIVRNNESEGR